jgi:hypothetical protein
LILSSVSMTLSPIKLKQNKIRIRLRVACGGCLPRHSSL